MNRRLKTLCTHAFLCLLGLVMIYPILWLFFAPFKTSQEILGSIALLPSRIDFSAYAEGWRGTGQYTFGVFMLNTLKMVIPCVAFTVLSSVVVAYGFARFTFIGKKPMFALMISTLMLPNAIIIIPRYMLYTRLGWNDSYLPFIVPALLACNPFFIFMMTQFFRGLPHALDESARIDGCNSLGILVKILVPLCKPAVISVALFQLIWTWNDFFNSLIFISSVKKYTLPLALKMTLDNEAAVNWAKVLAMSCVSILPLVLVFFFSQKYFVEGIATAGLKG